MTILLAHGLQLRPMQELDLSAVMAIETTAYLAPWTLQNFKDCLTVGYRCWSLEQDETLIGYGLMSVGAGEAHILNLGVAPNQRRRGYGNRILHHLLTLAKQEAVQTVFLEVRVSNQAAIQLYLQQGFKTIGKRKGYYVNSSTQSEDGLTLALEL